MPKDQETHDFIVRYRNQFYPNKDLWIGLNDIKTEGNFVWEDGTPLGNLNRWLPGQPNNVDNMQHCGVLTRENNTGGYPNQWRDDDCSEARGVIVICEKDILFCEEETLLTDAGQILFPRTEGGTFSYSKQLCQSTSGSGRPLVTRFCRLTTSGVAVWNSPVSLTCGINLQNLSQTTNVTEETALTVATKLQLITLQAETLSTDDIIITSQLLQEITNVSATKQIGESILTVADNTMKVNETVLLKSHIKDRAPARVLQALEMFADRVDLSTDRFTSKRQDVALQAADVSVQEFDQGQGLALFLNENGSSSLSEGRLFSFTKEDEREGFLQTADIDVSISLPANLSNVLPLDNTTDVRVSYILYNDDSLFVQPSQDAVRTRIISGRIAGMQVKNLPEPVVITFAPRKEVSDEEGKVVRCVFWDFDAEAGQGTWSSDGCMSQGKANGRYTCTCNHLTNFAVLFDVHGSGFGEHERPLEAITYVGSIVSIIALVLTLLSFIITRKQRQSARGPHARNQRLVLINLCVALLAILITFLAGIDQTASPVGCTAVAALLHYFLLAALMWMAVEAVMIFLAAVMVFGHYVSESFVYKAAVVAWGFPLLAILSTVGPSSFYEYKMSKYCWLAHLPMSYAFLLPAGLILMFNMIVFSIVMYKLAKREKVQKTLTGTKEEDVDKQWILGQLRRAFSIMSLFGLTWVFGFFVISGGQPAFAYLFCTFNTLQGLFVFIFHCVLREDMRKWLKSFDCKGKNENNCVVDESKSSSAAAELMQFKRVHPGNSPDGSFEELAE
ncbi:PREDICTED: adhesion G protein-coupled receptor L3-like [Branchiostoma belcheri]|uniref:Adhesion G protein-coupled receptor L3-like n=1 Tax=Branchiostoma belcheri TaxID=7741 RepID=A0A6P4XSI2_BRABE|nr:PREDICTED: adhesion G protein-coupled receptor L3-like [Branchiostoma belcheri]